MSLGAFFEAMGPFLRGETDADEVSRRLGPLPCPPADLAFYAELVAFDQQRILAELVPAAERWVVRTGGSWAALVRSYVAAHPPVGWSVPHVGERFADWLASAPGVPAGIEAVADLAWTRFRVRTAPDGPSLEVRHYPIDAVAVTRSLLAEMAPRPAGPSTILVYRHVDRLDVCTLPASLPTIGVLLEDAGETRAGPLADLSPETLANERTRLVACGAPVGR